MTHSLIYADSHFIAVNKPHKLLSVPGLSEPQNLFDQIKRTHPGARTVHRLDMATSGIILFALHYEAQKSLSRQFELKQIRKTYVALVSGEFTARALEISLPLGPSQSQKTRHQVDFVAGKPAQTWVQKIAATPICSRVLLKPVTGRSHQLRVHCQAIGHPIVGDPFYGDPHQANRMMLHACTVALLHPITGLPLTLNCTSPF